MGIPADTNIVGLPVIENLYKNFYKQYGEPKQYFYRDGDGYILQIVYRWQTPQGKEIRPVCHDGREWIPRAYRKNGLSPLYGLELIADNPNALFILCEGEKAADAIRHAGFFGISFGAKNSKTDFSQLKGKRVIVWGDIETDKEEDGKIIEGGLSMGRKLAIRQGWGMLDIENFQIGVQLKEGMDAADFSKEQIQRIIKSLQL